ncbi:MAG TPA: ABC transporter ATP-binding protein [Rhodothermales bacterium]|nr:ABC transporter ATP-binding protein [Rhodothermales bacterium]
MLFPHTWQAAQLPEALSVLAHRKGMAPAADATNALPAPSDNTEALNNYVEATAGRVGFEAEPVLMPYIEVEQTLALATPALVRVSKGTDIHFLVLTRTSRRHVYALGPDRTSHRLHPTEVRAALCASLEAPATAEVDRLLAAAGLPPTKQSRTALLREHLSDTQVEGLWLLRLPPSAPFLKQVQQAGLVRRLGGLMTAHTLQYVLWLLAWWTIGRAALQGRFDSGWLLAWTFLLLSLIPIRLMVRWLQGYLAVHVGSLLKRRLLLGALSLPLEGVSRQGIGQLFGRVIESNAVETLALSGGFLAFLSLLELGMAGGILALGAGGPLHAAALAGWITVTMLLARHYYRKQQAWTDERLILTDHLVERMIGHRTRLAQQARSHWHTDEDREVAHYLDTMRNMDHAASWLQAFVPRGWLVASFLAFAPVFVGGQNTAALAVSLGGILLAYQALGRLTLGLEHLTRATIAWEQVAELFHTGATQPSLPRCPVTVPCNPPQQGTVVLEAHDLTFRHAPGRKPVLRNVHLAVHAHDRLLLQGPSGGGKSTLSSLLTGLRQPETGLLLLRGLDRQTLGQAEWRRRVVAAPQFHENHVLTGTFAFNLLMGRCWPPGPDDLSKAEQLCRALGLGNLLNRMPAGLMQMVGETGWQLSHGERSRLFLARALLQQADFVVLDESFGTLDPENQALVMHCTLEQAPTLLVIAHP